MKNRVQEKSWQNEELSEQLDRELLAIKQILDEADREWLLMLAIGVLSVLKDKHGTILRSW